MIASMQIIAVFILTAVPASMAWWGFQSGNEFFSTAFGLVALAPVTALAAMKMKVF